MPDFVFDIPTRQLAVYVTLLAITLVAVGLLVVKPLLRLLVGTGPDFNQTLSYATSSFSLFYGLLLGLLTVAAYQNSERVREGILAEASGLGVLYADMNSYPEPIRSEMKTMMRDYVLFTIHDDWEAHRIGKVKNGGSNRTDALRQKLASFEPTTRGQDILHAEVISSFHLFSQARQQRLAGVITEIPDVLWYAVMAGAAVNILFIVLLKMRLLQQFFLGALTSFFLGVMLFVIVVLDRPLQGEAGLDPDPMQLLWDRSMIWDEPFS